MHGLGFSLKAGIVVIDLDNALDENQKPLEWVMPILEIMPQTFIEVSQSGKGLHLFLKASIGERRNRWNLPSGHHIEIYETDRFIAFTANRYEASPLILADGEEALECLYRDFLPKSSVKNPTLFDTQEKEPCFMGLRNDSLLEKMFNSENGSEIQALWHGNTAKYGNDDSRADMALLSHLSWWTNGNASQMENLFNQSALGQRPKWQERKDYRDRTISNVLASFSGGYRGGESSFQEQGLRSFQSQATPFLHGKDETVQVCQWDKPRPIQSVLLPVDDFDTDLLPLRAKAWLIDESNRMQVSIDFMAVTLMVTLGSLIGRQVGIRPKAQDNWLVVPNLWGMVIGKPSTMKTPSIQSVLKAVTQLEQDAFSKHTHVMKEYENLKRVMEIKQKALEQTLKKSFTVKNKVINIEQQAKEWEEETTLPPPPVCKRYMSNDPTVEKVGELLSQNSNGLLLFRDELAGFLKKLDKEGYESDRAFYLESWNGTGSYTFDRITRGTVYIEGHCLSVFGGIQPSVISKWLSDALTQTGKDDGLIQRFQLMVYPDTLQAIIHVDTPPNLVAKQNYYSLIQELAIIIPQSLGCYTVAGDSIPFLRFTEEAQPLFDDWHLSWRKAHLNGNENPTLEAHFTKYASLVPSLALICHLANGDTGNVSKRALIQALAWSDYLASHAHRIYAMGGSHHLTLAHVLLKKLKAEKLNNPFTLRELKRKHWHGFDTPKVIEEALDTLEEHGYILREERRTEGRPTVHYHMNPLWQGEA